MGDSQAQANRTGDSSARNLGDSGQQAAYLTSLLSQIPGAGSLCQQAEQLQTESAAQARANSSSRGLDDNLNYGGARSSHPGSECEGFQAPPGSVGGPPGPGIPGMSPNFDPVKTAKQIYPILEFRDKVVKAVSATIEKIPGLQALVEKITETLTLFVLSLLAPFIRPVINAVSKQLKNGSTTVIAASGKHQYEVWTDPQCSDPTHSLLSKDHFSNVLNEPAGQVASAILQYVAPRIIYAWQHPDVPIHEVMHDIVRVFHHPAIRDPRCEIHRTMFEVVERWAHALPNRGADLNNILSSDGVRHGKNHISNEGDDSHHHGSVPPMGNIIGSGSHSKVSGAPWEKLFKLSQSTGQNRGIMDLDETANTLSAAYPGTETAYDATRPPTGPAQEYQYPQQQYQNPTYQQDPYSETNYQGASLPQQPFSGYGAPPPDYQQGYGQTYQNPAPGYPPQDYPTGTPYGYDPNAPPREQSGSYRYRGQAPPPDGRYYGGDSYR